MEPTTILINIPPGGGFRLPALDATGTVQDVNQCEIRCLIARNGHIDSVRWSPHTEVYSDPTVHVTEDQSQALPGMDGSLTCACGKVCTSRSGYTLHRQRCKA